jgi:tRNA-modifying protein YgfZ
MSGRVVDRSPQGGVVARGVDATSFLQGLVSQDLASLADGEGTHSLLLSPQGKLDVDFRALRVGHEWWLDCEAAYGPRLAASLTRFKLRVDAELADVTSRWGLLTVLDPEGVTLLGELTSTPEPVRAHAHVGWRASRVVRADWPDRVALDLVGPAEDIAVARNALVDRGAEIVGPDAYEAMRIGLGMPRLGVDIDEQTIPQEAFLDLDAVSFTKGCFLGQELVARIDTRGHVNRYLRRVTVEGTAVPPSGASVVVDDRTVGTLTSVAEDRAGGRTVALGMVRREVEPPAAVTVRWETGEARARLEP